MAERNDKLKEQLARVRRDQPSAPAPVADASTATRVVGLDPADDEHAPERRRRPRPAGRRRPAVGESWDDRVKRATFYVDRALLDELDACCERNDLNKSEFVREAIIRHLQTYR